MAEPLYTIPGGDANRGRQAVADYGCAACHTIPGITGADATVGPSLAGWAKRRAIAGHFPNTPQNLVAWIQNPQQMSPGSIMPNTGVSEATARDISAYLYTLQRNPSHFPWW
jgi:cytochrome c2